MTNLLPQYERAPARIPEEDPPPPPPAPRGPLPSPDDLRQPRAAPRRPVGSIALPGFPGMYKPSVNIYAKAFNQYENMLQCFPMDIIDNSKTTLL